MLNKDKSIPVSKAAKSDSIAYNFPADKPIFWGPKQPSTFDAAYQPPDKDAWIMNHVLEIPKVARFFFGDGGPDDQHPPDNDARGNCWALVYTATGLLADPQGRNGVVILNGVATQTANLWISIWKDRGGDIRLCGPEKDYQMRTPVGASFGIYVYGFLSATSGPANPCD